MQRQTLQAAYSRGVVRDLPRYELPQGAVWGLKDFLPNTDGAPLQKRGGWRAGEPLALASSLNAVAYSPFGGSDKFCLIDDRGHLWFSNIIYFATVLGHTPQLYWRLDEAYLSTAVKDKSAFGRTGTATHVSFGQVGAITGDPDQAANTARAFSSILADTYNPFQRGSSRTFMGWAKRTSTAGADVLFEGEATPGLVISAGSENITFKPSASAAALTWAAAWPATGVWVFWVLTYNDASDSGRAELFINGVSKGAQSYASGLQYPSLPAGETNRFLIGDLTGYLDEYAVFSSILSSASISDIYSAASGGSGMNDVGAFTTTKQRPVFFNDLLIALPSGGAFTTPKKFDGVTISNLAMSGLVGVTPSWGVAYKSRLVIADSDTLYFSDILDPEVYDVDSFVKATHPITGLAALPNMIAIFSAGAVERLRGTTPPSTLSDGDMALEPAFAEGCIDARSIVVYQDQMIWANLNGVHVSDGASIANLAAVGGIQQYWTDLMQSYTSNWVLAGGIYKGHYIVSITDGSGTEIASFLCNLATKTWTFLSNVKSMMFSESQGSASELMMAVADHNYAGYFASVFTPDSSSLDGDGTAVEPEIEFPFFRSGSGSTRWRDLFLGVDLENGDGQTADLELYYTTSPDGESYTQLLDDTGAPVTIGGTDGYELQRIATNLAANGIGLKIVQVGASNKTALFELEALARIREGRF